MLLRESQVPSAQSAPRTAATRSRSRSYGRPTWIDLVVPARAGSNRWELGSRMQPVDFGVDVASIERGVESNQDDQRERKDYRQNEQQKQDRSWEGPRVVLPRGPLLGPDPEDPNPEQRTDQDAEAPARGHMR